MDLQGIGTIGGVILVFLSTLIGIRAKRKSDAQAAKDAADEAAREREATERKATADREAQRAQEMYDSMQDDLLAARTEVRSLQDDLGRARTELNTMWSQMASMRRQLEAAEAHIADIHRWDASGRTGPIPPRPQVA